MNFTICAAVDILDGKCVQLEGGKLGTEKFYGDPTEAAKHWEEKGADLLHVIDLDGSLGKGNNFHLVKKIISETSLPVQVGGGIRDAEKIKDLVDLGADKIIVGTRAVKDPSWLNEQTKTYKKRMVLAIDARDHEIVIEGWKRRTSFNLVDLAREVDQIGLAAFLYTNVDVEGQAQGIHPKPIRDLVQSVNTPVIVAGGITSEQDVKEIYNLGVRGIVIGTALYSGKLSIKKIKDVSEIQ